MKAHDSWRVPALDGVRGLAILAVMGFHFAVELAPGGAYGVEVFFVLSAFLITTLLLREYDRTGTFNFAAFYCRRVFRLLPALLIFLLLIAPPIATVIGTADQIPTSSADVLFYVADFARAGILFPPIAEPYGHTWSLAVEEQFYVVWPALLLIVLRWMRPIVVGIGLWVLGVILSALVTSQLGVGQNYFLPSGHLSALAIGCLVAFLLRGGMPALLDQSRRNIALPVVSLLVLALMVVLPRASWAEPWATVVNLLGAIATGALLLHLTSNPTSLPTKLLTLGVLTWFGKRSYGIYLYHTAFYYLFAAPHVEASRTVNTVLAITISLLVSELSFRFVEKPILSKGRQWLKSRSSNQSEPPAMSLTSQSGQGGLASS